MTEMYKIVGNTPLIQLSEKLYAKFETYNPSGSIKDRMVSYILKEAERTGKLKKGDTIIEATSGNTGIAISMFGAANGYEVVIIMPENMSEERVQMMKAFGAKVWFVEAGDFDGAIDKRDRYVKEFGWFTVNQFHNPLNIECHYETTGVEILQQAPYKISAFVDGTGTGGTVMGVRKRLIEKYPDVQTVVVEPQESPVMSGGEPGLHGIQGIGDGSKFLVDLSVVDDIMMVRTESAKEKTRELISKGLLVGISSGANVLAAERWIEKNNPEGIVVTVLCDRGERYLTCL
tara:strand:- start:1092 stop:1958 length:867 start_codon:yes stop_codon:yes gene_type:complete